MSKAQFDQWFSYDGLTERYPCLALCKCTKTGNIIHAGNIASITRLSLGHWRVIFSRPVPSADYVVTGGTSAAVSFAQTQGIVLYCADGNPAIEPPTVNGFTFGVLTASASAWADPDIINFTVHGRMQ